MSDLTQSVIAFVQAHESWIVPIVFGLAFCEFSAFGSLIVPATVILLCCALWRAQAKRLILLGPSERILRGGTTQKARKERLQSPIESRNRHGP
jgi:hypothetical protein